VVSGSVGRGGAAAVPAAWAAAPTAAAAWVGAATAARPVWVQPRLRRREELERLARERRFDGGFGFLAFVDVKSRARSTC
jgi:hypothetical protein